MQHWAENILRQLKINWGTSLVVQWLRICLPVQGTQVQSLVREDPTCCGATKPVRHNYWACMLQLLRPACLDPMLHNKRSHCNEKPVHRNQGKPMRSSEDTKQPKINKLINFKKINKLDQKEPVLFFVWGLKELERSWNLWDSSQQDCWF